MMKAPAVGMNSGSGDDCIIFLDYDFSTLDEAAKDAIKVKRALKLGPFEMLKTNKGFHVVFWWDKVNEQTRDTAIEMSHCDDAFKKKPKKTIRVAGKYCFKDIKRIGVFKEDGESLSGEGLRKMEFASAMQDLVQFDVAFGPSPPQQEE